MMQTNEKTSEYAAGAIDQFIEELVRRNVSFTALSSDISSHDLSRLITESRSAALHELSEALSFEFLDETDSSHGIRVTVEDLDGKQSAEQIVIHDDYVCVTAGDCHVAHTQVYQNGTHILTIKGRKPS